MAPSFGRAVRKLWGLREDATFLNHGSFGACPLEVLNVQDRIRREMESQPDVFFRGRIIPQEKETELRAVAEVYASDDANAKFTQDFATAWAKVMNLDRR